MVTVSLITIWLSIDFVECTGIRKEVKMKSSSSTAARNASENIGCHDDSRN